MDSTTLEAEPTVISDLFVDPVTATGCSSGIELARMITGIFLQFPIAVLGLFLNTLALIVLRKQKHATTTRMYLMALAIADNFVLVSVLMLSVLRRMPDCLNILHGYLRVFAVIFVVFYPGMFVARLAGTWFMTLLTVDRCIAVCFPLKAMSWCSSKRATKQVRFSMILKVS